MIPVNSELAFLMNFLFCFDPTASFGGFREIKFPSKTPRADRGNEHQLQLLHATEMDPYKTSYLCC